MTCTDGVTHVCVLYHIWEGEGEGAPDNLCVVIGVPISFDSCHVLAHYQMYPISSPLFHSSPSPLSLPSLPSLPLPSSQTAIPVPSPVTGIVEELFIADGDTVSPGAQLCRIKASGDAPPTEASREAETREPPAKTAPPPPITPPSAAAAPEIATPIPTSAPPPPPLPGQMYVCMYAAVCVE